MYSFLLYVDPAEGELARVVDWAADLVEAATYAASDAMNLQPRRIGLVADLECCSYIGLAMLGRGSVRTVERGERQESPLRVFPFARSRGDDDESDSPALLCLRELADAGAVEGVSGRSTDAFSSSAEVLRTAVASAQWEALVILGTFGESLPSRDQAERLRVITPMSDDAASDRLGAVPLYVDGESEDLRGIRLAAALDAVRFIDLLEQLGIVD